MCPQSEVYKKSVATSVLAVRVRVDNGCTVRTRRFIMVETCLHLPRLASTCLARIIIIIIIIVINIFIIIIASVLISRLELPTLA